MVAGRIASAAADPSILGTELVFPCGRRVNNRFLKAAMSEHFGTWNKEDVTKRGIPRDTAVNAYQKWGRGGFGLIVTGNVPVDPDHMQLAENILVCKENDGPELRRQLQRSATAMKAGGALAIMQLTHAGGQTPLALNPTPYAPSDVPKVGRGPFNKFGKPIPLPEEKIVDVVERFQFAAEVALETGFDGIQIYAAHGFLLSEFLSLRTNKRTDRYGGSAENRFRIVLEIYDAIRKTVPTDFVVGLKMNSVEFQEDGLATEDAKTMCRSVEDRGFDFVELSGGTVEMPAFHAKESTRAREAFFLEFTDKIRPVFRNTVMYVTGGFRTVAGMVAAVAAGSTQGIGLARPVASEPDLPLKLISGEALSAVDNKFDPDDYKITAIAAVTQLALMGKRPLEELEGRVTGDIPDFSMADEVEHFLKALDIYKKKALELVKQNLPINIGMEYETLHSY